MVNNGLKIKIKQFIMAVMVFCLFLPLCTVNVAAKDNIVVKSESAISTDEVDIIFTSDIHAHLGSYDVKQDGKVKNVGGFSRFKAFIDKIRDENDNVLLVDAGDEVMGTLAQALIDTDAPELSFISEFSYDAITTGNHEYDYGVEAISKMYELIAEKYEKHPAFVNCNIDFTKEDEYTKRYRKALDTYGRAEYVVVDKNGIKIAITGVLGKDAIKCAPTCELTFIDPLTAVKNTVEKIKKNENPDMIVLLSHSGEDDVLEIYEDVDIAKAVPDLDVIVSGHTHTVRKEATVVGDTYIVSPGQYLMYAGHLSLKKNSKGRWDMTSYELKELNESIESDAYVQQKVQNYFDIIDENVLSEYDVKLQDTVCYNEVDFETELDLHDMHTETKLGNLLSDAYRYAANSTPTGQEHIFSGSVAPAGTVRDTFLLGEITTEEAFSVLSLGVGSDGMAGYPLVSLYLSAEEIRTVSEVDATVSDLMKAARLYMSGACFSYNPYRMPLNKVNDVWVCEPILEESRTELDDKKLYRVVTDLYSMQMLGAVTDLSKGLLSIVPKDENGNPIEDINTAIIYDENGNELKAWTALIKYLKSFTQDENGISHIPDYYNVTHNRKIVDKSLNPVSLLKNTNKFFFIILLIIILLIIAIVSLVRLIIKKKHQKKVFYEKKKAKNK